MVVGRQYGKNNNVKLDTWMPGRCEYAFADVPEHRADKLFIRSEIPVRFKRGEMSKAGVDYIIVFCRFKKQYEEAFLECMADLERAMVLEGRGDYGEFCGSLLGPIIERNNVK